LKDTGNYGLSLVLGAGEMKLLEHVGAYTVFANGGIKKDYRAILEVKDASGKVILKNEENKGKRVWDEKEIYELNWALCDLGGFGDQPMKENYYLNGKRTFCGKTGTTDGPKDLTSMMYSKSLVIGVWAGNNDNTETPGAWSTTVPLPIAGSFMTKMASKYKPEPFNRPSGIVATTVCNDTGEIPGKDSNCKKVASISIVGKSPKIDERERVYICKDSNKLSNNEVFARANNLGVDKYILKKKLENTLQQSSYEKYMTKSVSILFEKPEEAECKIPIGTDGVPTVALYSPTNGETIYPNSNVNIAASANASSGVNRVEFMFDGVSLGNDTTYPYALTYTTSPALTAGSHIVTAIVYDNSGGSASSSVTVNASVVPITINILTPTNSSNNNLPMNFSASTIGAGVSKVDFVITSGSYSTVITDTTAFDGWVIQFNDSGIPNGNNDYTAIARAYKGSSIFYSGSVSFKINK
jgi:membrane carboxypeptidase/penicillin-binding protein PbpC